MNSFDPINEDMKTDRIPNNSTIVPMDTKNTINMNMSMFPPKIVPTINLPISIE